MECFLQSSTNFPCWQGRWKERKEKNPNKNYLVLFISLKQAASSAGLAPFKPLHSHRKRTKPLSHSAHPVPRDMGHPYPKPSSKPEVPRQGECTNSKPAEHLNGSSWARREERPAAARRQGKCVTALLSCILCIYMPCQALPWGRESRHPDERSEVSRHCSEHHVVLWMQFSKDATVTGCRKSGYLWLTKLLIAGRN